MRGVLTCDWRQFVDEVVPEDAVKLERAIRNRNISKKTVANLYASLKKFLCYIGIDPKAISKPPKLDNRMPEIHTDEELNAQFSKAISPKVRPLFELLLQTGAREKEAHCLEWSDIREPAMMVFFHAKVDQYDFRMKDFEHREAPLPRAIFGTN